MSPKREMANIAETLRHNAMPDAARRDGDALDHFFDALREVDAEYGRAEISPAGAMAEVRAALRQLDRHQTMSKEKRP